MQIDRRVTTFVCTIALVLALGACGNDPAAEDADPEAGSGGGSVTVTAQDFAFSPTEVSIPAGESVTITLDNQDDTQHSFTVDDADVDIVADGGSSASGDVTVEGDQTLEFRCRFHSSMTGTLVVGAGGSDAGGGDGEDKMTDDTGYDY